MSKRTFDVEVVKGGAVLVMERDPAGNWGLIAAGTPKRCADTLKETFEEMRKGAA